MTQRSELTDARRALLEKYLRGDLARKAVPSHELPPIPRRMPGHPIPLSFGQQQLWLLSQLLPDTSIYSESVIVRIPGLLDVAALERTLNEVIRRHEAWRTSFPLLDGEPVQLIHPSLHLPLPLIDLRDLSSSERSDEVQRVVQEQAHLPFDLASGPLLRFVLMRLDNEEHRLCMTLHHIIFDGVAVYQVFLSELSSIYQAFASGQPSPLPELPYQYADFALWQRNWLEGERMEQQLAYWKERLVGASTTLELPTDRPHPPTQSYRGAAYTLVLPRSLVDALKALSQREGVTLYMTLVAAFNILLYRYTGQEDLLLGTSTVSRRRSEFEGMLGYFLNTLVLRSDLSGDPTFREMLGKVREVILSARSNEDVPFEYVVKELHPERNLSQNPIFQVLLTLVPPQPALASGWSLSQMEVHTGTSKFDLYLELDERVEGLVGRFVYSTDLFDEATIARMAGHWRTLLEGIAAHPERHLSTLSMLTEPERQQLLTRWNNSEVSYPAGQCLHHLFEEQVARAPEATALVCEGERLSYEALNRRANQVAHFLQKLGVGPEILVGICVERSIEMVVGLLGILKAGGAYVPLDPAYPAERLAFILQDAHTPVLLTQQKFLVDLPVYEGQVVCLDSDWERIAREDAENVHLDMSSTCLAYVIYTSGSTGQPKGVLVSHANVVRLFAATQEWYHFGQHDVWTLFHSYAFDFSVWELWGALLYGGRLVIVSYWTSRTTEAFYDLLRTERVTVLNQTPSAFYQLIQAEETKGIARDLALRLVIFGGEALEFHRLRPWFERHGDQSPRLVNMYGITETTVHVSYYPLSIADTEQGAASVIGCPIPDLQLYLLDQQRQLVPPGVPGEMYVGGAGVARGYLNRPELTAKRFINHSFDDGPAIHLYRTGDLARYRTDGLLEFLGRADQQVKIRGYRIELGEIEAALLQHPAVQQAIVLAREDTPGEKRLVAYIVGQQEPRLASATELRRFLQSKLPEYMVPPAFVLLDALPLTTHGKLDRRALPAPDQDRAMASVGYVAPYLPLHHQLVHIWEELISARPIGIRDNFFDLGGHSLLAARMVNRIEQVCDKKIPLSTLFAGATIEHLTNVLLLEEQTAKPTLTGNTHVPFVTVQSELPGSTKKPFFFLHGDWLYGAYYCMDLARGLGPDQPFYVLEPYVFDAREDLPTLERMASAHIETMRAIQPEGPYLLGGWCNGGLLAYEMARQLYCVGQRVDLLVLMDPAVPFLTNRAISPLQRSGRFIVGRAGQLLGLSHRQRFDAFLRIQHVYRSLRYAHYRSSQKTENDRMSIKEQNDHWGHLFEWIAGGYVPSGYPGGLTIFWDSEDLYRRAGWQKVAHTHNVEVHIIPGTHITCRTDHLGDLAACLKTCVEKTH